MQEDLGAAFVPSKLTKESTEYARCFLRTGQRAWIALSISMVLVTYSVGSFVPSIFEAFFCKFSKKFQITADRLPCFIRRDGSA